VHVLSDRLVLGVVEMAQHPAQMVVAAVLAIALAVEGGDVDRQIAQTAHLHQRVDALRRQAGAVGERRGRQPRLPDAPHLVEEPGVEGGLVVADHEHRFDRLAERGDFADDALVGLGGHEVGFARRHRHRAEVALLVADGVGFEGDVFEVIAPRQVGLRVHQPAGRGQRLQVVVQHQVVCLAVDQQPQPRIARSALDQGLVGVRVVEPVVGDVEIWARPPGHPGPGHESSLGRENGQGCGRHAGILPDSGGDRAVAEADYGITASDRGGRCRRRSRGPRRPGRLATAASRSASGRRGCAARAGSRPRRVRPPAGIARRGC
jgi:hypothetical protein